jgi:hypothetical protein
MCGQDERRIFLRDIDELIQVFVVEKVDLIVLKKQLKVLRDKKSYRCA